ncbi:MAG: acyl-CoA thioester hydrolase [Miltoncostaeaceae bacterium]|nr:acyl-CoA thioester hydrolase [Miltoncostaeaceae bacterium]
MSGPYKFSALTRVEFADTDAGGVLYYGRYPRYLDKGVMAYRRNLGLDLLGPPGHVYVIRALAIRYAASAVFDDPLELFVRVARIGRTSHTLHIRVDRIGELPVQLAEAELVQVGLDDYGGRPTEMPPELRERLRGFEGGDLELA